MANNPILICSGVNLLAALRARTKLELGVDHRKAETEYAARRPIFFNPFRTRTQHGCTHMDGRRRLLFLTTCSDDSKPYMILEVLVKGYQNHIGSAII